MADKDAKMAVSAGRGVPSLVSLVGGTVIRLFLFRLRARMPGGHQQASFNAARPKTGASLSFSSAASVSAASSLSGGALDALVARRSQLRSQLAAVERELAVCPPRSSAPSTPLQPYSSLRPIDKGMPPSLQPVPPRDSGAKQLSSKHTAASTFSGAEDSLPGAMQAGRYAFWPKRLPGAQSRQIARESSRARAAVTPISAHHGIRAGT